MFSTIFGSCKVKSVAVDRRGGGTKANKRQVNRRRGAAGGGVAQRLL